MMIKRRKQEIHEINLANKMFREALRNQQKFAMRYGLPYYMRHSPWHPRRRRRKQLMAYCKYLVREVSRGCERKIKTFF